MNHFTSHLLAYTAPETERLMHVFFGYFLNIVNVVVNAWTVTKLNSMDAKRSEARNQLAAMIEENKEAIARTRKSAGFDPDDLPPSMRIDP